MGAFALSILRRSGITLVVAAACLAGGTPRVPVAAPPEPRDASAADFAEVRKQALEAARGRSSARRIEALGRLAGYGSTEAIDLVVRVGFGSKDEEVRAAARAALEGHREEEAFARSLVERIGRELRANRLETAGELAALLLAASDGEGSGPLVEWLDGAGAEHAASERLCWAVATAAAARGGPGDVAALRGLARIGLFDSSFPFRRGVVRALVAIHSPEAVETLVDLLADLPGEARADVVAYLAHVSGENHGTDADGWRLWLDGHRDGIELPPELAEYPPPRTPPDSPAARDPAYYGIPLYAARVVFLVDTSSSMEERGRLETAKRELESAVFVLPPEAEFTIIAYSDRAVPWERRLVPADDAAKRRAAAFIRALVPDGRTATGDALELAFGFDTEAVYLLSDGKPTAGRVVEPARIVRWVAEANKSRRVSLHAIGIAPDPGLAEFLEVLARANFGQFRRVDE